TCTHRGTRHDVESAPDPGRNTIALRDAHARAVRAVLLGHLKPGVVVRPALPLGPRAPAGHQRPHSPCVEERLRRGQQTGRAQGGRGGQGPAREAPGDGPRLPAVPGAEARARVAAWRDHPTPRTTTVAVTVSHTNTDS